MWILPCLRRCLPVVIVLGLTFGSVPSRAADSRNLEVGSVGSQRVALVIGNSAYVQGRLRNPVNDARAIQARLKNLGFDVILKENLKTRDIGGIYREFRSKIVPGGVALVFYAGHGVQFKGQNFFPAVDADINFEEDVPLQSLNLGTLLDNMEEAKAGVSLVFLDACRDNPFARRFRSGTRGLAKVESASGTLIHYATRPGSVADDGDGNNGTYTEALLAHLSEPGVPVEQVLKRVTNRVMDKTKGKQEPWIEGSLRGDFYFLPTTAQTSTAAQQAVPVYDQTSVEIAFWESIKNSTDPADHQAYLDKYPNGQFVALAERRARNPAVTELPTSGVVTAQQQLTGSDSKKDWATIYFVRASRLGGSSVNWNVMQNNRLVGQLPNGSYFELKTVAGKHTFSLNPTHTPNQVSDSATYEIASGKTYYIEYDLGGLFGDRTLQLISEEKGKDYLRTLRQTNSSVAQ